MPKFKITTEHGFEIVQATDIFAAMRAYQRAMKSLFRPAPIRVELVTD